MEKYCTNAKTEPWKYDCGISEFHRARVSPSPWAVSWPFRSLIFGSAYRVSSYPCSQQRAIFCVDLVCKTCLKKKVAKKKKNEERFYRKCNVSVQKVLSSSSGARRPRLTGKHVHTALLHDQNWTIPFGLIVHVITVTIYRALPTWVVFLSLKDNI